MLRVTSSKEMLILLALGILCFSLATLVTKTTSYGQGQVKETVQIDKELPEILVNPELQDESSLREVAQQFLFVLDSILTLPNTYKNHILKQGAIFFLRFNLGNPSMAEYTSIDDKIYVRMPKYEPKFRNLLLKFIKQVYGKVAKKWEAIGLKRPNGFIYVWLLSNLDEMQYEFGIYEFEITEERTRAFALPCRYIVVPYRAISSYEELMLRIEASIIEPSASTEKRLNREIEKFLKKQFKRNFTHELTHVFINSTVGFKGIEGMDKWFHEGMAIWFSKEKEESLSREYKDYRRLFEFIRMKYGNKQFLAFIREAITRGSVIASLQSTFNIFFYGELQRKAENYYKEIKRIETGILALCVIILIVVVIRWANNKACLPLFLVIIAVFSLYFWRSGRLNLWTDSVAGGFVLNSIAIILILLNLAGLARYFYLSHVLRLKPREARAIFVPVNHHVLLFTYFEVIDVIDRLRPQKRRRRKKTK